MSCISHAALRSFDIRAIRDIPIQDNGEPLVAASLAPQHLILARPQYALQQIPGAPAECFVREGVLQRLLQAARALPDGHRLVLLDTWRPMPVQTWLFDRYMQELKARSGNGANAERFVSAPLNDAGKHPPFHLTGGAVDLSIADSCGLLLDMGTPFDATSEDSYTAAPLGKTSPRDRLVNHNREMLYRVMTKAGFVNFPYEWWHFDYGDQLWAALTGTPYAIYGATLPEMRWAAANALPPC